MTPISKQKSDITFEYLLNLQHYYSRKSNYYIPIKECVNWSFNRGLTTLHELIAMHEFIDENSHLF